MSDGKSDAQPESDFQEATENRRAVDARYSADFIRQALQLPPNTRIVAFSHPDDPEDRRNGIILLRVVSPAFDPVDEGEQIPTVDAKYREGEGFVGFETHDYDSGKPSKDAVLDAMREYMKEDEEFRDDLLDILAQRASG